VASIGAGLDNCAVVRRQFSCFLEMGCGFCLKIQLIECETKIEVGLGQIRIGLDGRREMILCNRPMAHLIVGNAVGIVLGGGGIAARRRQVERDP